MKKILIITLFFIGISALSHAQSAGKGGSEKSGSFFSHIFHGGQKPHKQMGHFGKQRKDPNIKDNGTAYRRKQNQRSAYKVDGDGFGTAKQSRSGRRKKRGVQ